MTPLDQYYKYYNLSGISPELLKNEELFNLYRRPLKEKRSERPKVIVWKVNATQQSDLGELPIDPKGYHYFLVLVEISRRQVDGEPIKNKTAQSVLYGVSAGKKYQIEIFFKKMFLSKKDVKLAIWFRTFVS